MTIPSILFALLIALLLGAFYHFVRDGGPWHLISYLMASMLGFAAGHLVGLWRGWVFFQFGPYNLGLELLGSIVFLALTDWLLHLEPRGPAEGENGV